MFDKIIFSCLVFLVEAHIHGLSSPRPTVRMQSCMIRKYLHFISGCQLIGKVFYKVDEQVFCEADYLVSAY